MNILTAVKFCDFVTKNLLFWYEFAPDFSHVIKAGNYLFLKKYFDSQIPDSIDSGELPITDGKVQLLFKSTQKCVASCFYLLCVVLVNTIQATYYWSTIVISAVFEVKHTFFKKMFGFICLYNDIIIQVSSKYFFNTCFEFKFLFS